ncbi:hypothetical protein ALFP_1025 [Alcaligenes faecalis]|nr:hypothetical protein ALFP_1025 [Alcaligenes faecalis]
MIALPRGMQKAAIAGAKHYWQCTYPRLPAHGYTPIIIVVTPYVRLSFESHIKLKAN